MIEPDCHLSVHCRHKRSSNRSTHLPGCDTSIWVFESWNTSIGIDFEKARAFDVINLQKLVGNFELFENDDNLPWVGTLEIREISLWSSPHSKTGVCD